MEFKEIAVLKNLNNEYVSFTQNYIVISDGETVKVYDLEGNKKGEVDVDGDSEAFQTIERNGEFISDGNDMNVIFWTEEDLEKGGWIEPELIGNPDENVCKSTGFKDNGERLIIGSTSYESFIMYWYNGAVSFIPEGWELLSVGYDLIVAEHYERGKYIVDEDLFPLCKINDEGEYLLTKDDKYLINYKDNNIKIYKIEKNEDSCKVELFKEINIESEIKGVEINEKNNDIGIITYDKVLIYDIEGNLKGVLNEKLSEIALRGDKLIGLIDDKNKEVKIWKMIEE